MDGDTSPVTASQPSCCSPADAQPTEAEREVWDQVDVVLKDAKAILDELQAYKGAGQEIREVHLILKRHTQRLQGRCLVLQQKCSV